MLPKYVTPKSTLPDGTEAMPFPVSDTKAVHKVMVFTGTDVGEQFTLIEDGRFETWRTMVAELL